MRHVAFLGVFFLFSPATFAADLPPGVLLRLGDDRFRAGSGVHHISFSPNGTQFATARPVAGGVSVLTVWDAATGQPLRGQKVNNELLKGCVWGPKGGYAIFIRVNAQRISPDDFLVWEFTDPSAEPPPVLEAKFNHSGEWRVIADRPKGGDEYIDFDLGADGERVAALWKSAKEKYAVHVFELKPADTAKKLKQVAALDLGSENARAVRISGNGKTVVTFRPLRNTLDGNCAATPWDVATAKATKPVNVTYIPWLSDDPKMWYFPALTHDGGALVDTKPDGYDLVDLATGKRRTIPLQPLPEGKNDRSYEILEGSHPAANLCFPTGRIHVEARSLRTRIVDLESGKELRQLRGHTSTPTATAVSADGTRMATADCDGIIRLWDAKTLRPINDVAGHRSPVNHAQLSPDGKRLLTWAADETTRLWDFATGKELRAFTDSPVLDGENRSYLNEPRFTPDGTMILYGTNKKLIARDLQSGNEVPLPGDMAELGPRLVAFSPDGKSALTRDVVVAGCEVWDWPSGNKRFRWEADPDTLRSTGFTPGFSVDGSVIFHNVKSSICCDSKTGKALQFAWNAPHVDSIRPLHSLQSAPSLGVAYRKNDDLLVFEAGTGKQVSRFRLGYTEGGFPTNYPHISLSPTGGHYAWASEELPDEVNLFESASGAMRRRFVHRGAAHVLGFTPDGSRLLTSSNDHTVLVWDMRLQNVPLPDDLKKETDPMKLWGWLDSSAPDAYLRMARLASDPDATLRVMKQNLKPIIKGENGPGVIRDARAVEVIESLGSEGAQKLLNDLATGDQSAFRTQEAKRALERLNRK
ncbi:MAG: hypothetical protein K8U57_11885 [Planctomycetes bacterium]|nr:hypothetical protein [Planctomycetota bacterium]